MGGILDMTLSLTLHLLRIVPIGIQPYQEGISLTLCIMAGARLANRLLLVIAGDLIHQRQPYYE
jgi:hypothetical protein